ERAVEVEQLRRTLAEGGDVALDGLVVPPGDRSGQRGGTVVRPIRGGAKYERSQQLPRLLAGARVREKRCRGFLQRDQEVGCDRGGRVIGGAVLFAHTERAHPEGAGEAAREVEGGIGGAGDGAGRSSQVGVRGGNGL